MTESPFCLAAAPDWQQVDFISDLHVQADLPHTVSAWHRYLQGTPAQAVFILGDLFEVWVGDDAAVPGSFEAACAHSLHEAARQRPLYFVHGNRDFLLGPAFARQAGLTLLPDPTVLSWQGQRLLLSHGDALCLADRPYMQFRQQVRQASWQAQFLAQPLSARLAQARALRAQSEARKQSAQGGYADADTALSLAWLQAAQAQTLIHGHTHRPQDHVLAPGLRRVVLSDWDGHAQPPRAQVLRLHRPEPGQALRLERLTLAQSLRPPQLAP